MTVPIIPTGDVVHPPIKGEKGKPNESPLLNIFVCDLPFGNGAYVTFLLFLLYIQVIHMLVVIIIVFVSCWTPYLSFQALQVNRRRLISQKQIENNKVPFLNFQAFGYVDFQLRGWSKHLKMTFTLMAYLNSALNPIVYGFMSRSFRESFRKFACSCLSSSKSGSSGARGGRRRTTKAPWWWNREQNNSLCTSQARIVSKTPGLGKKVFFWLERSYSAGVNFKASNNLTMSKNFDTPPLKLVAAADVRQAQRKGATFLKLFRILLAGNCIPKLV